MSEHSRADHPPDTAEGPYFDELVVGQEFDTAPGVTLTSGLVGVHQSIVGDRLALNLDSGLCREVTGAESMVSPALVWNLAIGQSTVATHHVKANLFYRGLVLHRSPGPGDTLRTSTKVVAMRQNKPREGRRPTGLAVLRMTTLDQYHRLVLDFHRCAMLPVRNAGTFTEHADNLDTVGEDVDHAPPAAVIGGWRLDRFERIVSGPRFAELRQGQTWQVGGGDVVSNAPELARLTLNVAKVHHDSEAAGGERLVYGGHTIGIALSQAARALPTIVTVASWHRCDHVGPVYEGDTLRSTVSVERTEPLAAGGGLVHLCSRVYADGDPPRDVLDWRYVVAVA